MVGGCALVQEVVLAASLVPAAPVLPLVLGPALERGRSRGHRRLQRVVHHLLHTPVHRAASRGQTLDNNPPTVSSHHNASHRSVSRNNRPSTRYNDPPARTNRPSVRGM